MAGVRRPKTRSPANSSLVDLTELSGNGYTRQFVPANAAGMVSAAGGANGRALTTAEVTFTASGGSWGPAKTKFLTTTADDSGKLISIEPLNAGNAISLADELRRHNDHCQRVVKAALA